jgi:DNA polymerase III subunit gamma/tau
MNDATTPDDPNAPSLGLATSQRAPHYRVLARKYRPSSFDDLIGQEAMVRTISNAFETGRIPQAWILTGVRGVGKTTTARILARALNYALPDGSVTGPSIKMPALGIECQAIMESRHVDVLEMDAASHNSVDDIRQINDAVRYSPVSARYKVYILDEVHMLSGAAFNALLKTLEEPPPHAKFIFATTEIRKVPVTVLSRCQRFDLRRVEAGVLVTHLEGIATKEGLTAEPEALALIARAAEGSVRDALSLLDQAIAHAAGSVRAVDVRQMLGLADRSRVIDLFDALMRGDIAGALKELRDQYDAGADPAVVLTDLAEFTHFVTRVKVVPAVADDRSLAEIERTRGRTFAAALSMRVLSRAWQMLFKGIPEVQSAAKPIAAAEMVLVRIAYAADLPTPDELVRSLSGGESAPSPRRQGTGEGGGTAARIDAPREPPRDAPTALRGVGPRAAAAPQRQEPVARQAEPAPPGAATVALARFEDLVALAAEKRDLPTRSALERDVRLVRFEPGRLEVALEPSASKAIVSDLARKISQWTGQRWMVVVSGEQGQATIREQNEARRAALEVGVQADPLVKAVLAKFPGAQIVAVREGMQELPPATAEGDVMPPEPPLDDEPIFAEHIQPDDLGEDD